MIKHTMYKLHAQKITKHEYKRLRQKIQTTVGRMLNTKYMAPSLTEASIQKKC